MKPRSPIARIGKRKMEKLGGRKVYSTVRKKPRSKSEFQRIYGSKERVLFVKGLRCPVSWCSNATPTENCHIEGDGVGRKSAYTKIVPLCQLHHLKLHDLGRDSFEQTYHIDLEKCAEETERAWQSRISEREG